MEELKEVEEHVFLSKKENYDFVFESEYERKCFEFKVVYKNKPYIVGFAQTNNGLSPQAELHSKFILLGVNDSLIIIDLEQKTHKKYEVFPVFYQFIVKDNYVIVIGELSVLIFDNYELKIQKSFDEVIDIQSFNENTLTLRDFNGQMFQINLK